MEKTELIQNLRTKVGEDNCKVISDKTFDGIAESVLPLFADDSKITDDTWKLPVATLIQFAGQKRFDEKEFTEKFKADYTTQHEKDVEDRIKKATDAAVQKAIEDYKKEHPEQKSDPKDLDAKVAAAVAEAIKGITGEGSELSKSLATITSFVNTQKEREKTQQKDRVRDELKKHLIGLKANNEACVDDALDDIEYGDDPKFDELKQKAIDAYEKRYKRYYADGGKPFGGNGGSGGGSGDSDFVKDRINRLKKEAEDNANYSEELKKGFQ